MSAELIYAYGLVRTGFDSARLPAGVDDAPVVVRQVGAGEFNALISRLPGDQYDPREIERQSADVSWLSQRAMAHDRVLTWAQEHGGVVPFPIFTLFGSESALGTALTAEGRAALLRDVFRKVDGADEYGIRMYRRDDRMLASLDKIDASIAGLQQEASAASPGQRYLLERKVAEQSKAAIRTASKRIAQQVFERLRGLTRDAISRALTPDPDRAGEATLVLNGAFLVDRSRVDAFRREVAAIVSEFEPLGLSIDFTGPWPPYNFVGDMSAAGGGG